MRDVAEHAGVSATTVSHVINETRLVSDELRERVLAAIDELDYRPNHLARSLRRGRTHTIGMIIPTGINPYFAEIAQGVEETSFEEGYSVILCNSKGSPDKARTYADVLVEKQVDGILLVSVELSVEGIRTLQAQQVPLVVVNRDISGSRTDSVLVDQAHGSYLGTRHLTGQGHRRVACITGPSDLTPSAERIAGYRQGLAEAGVPVDESLILESSLDFEGGYEAACQLIPMARSPTAVVAGNDLMALGTIRAAREMGRRVPEDLSVVGYDDVILASYSIPPLTTIAQPRHEIGVLAATLLLERMRDPDLPPRQRSLDVSLVVRQSTAPPGPGSTL